MVTITRAAPRPRATPVPADWLAATVLALAAVAIRAAWFGDPVADFDEQLYSFIGWRMTHGDLPYVEVWDRKPFGLFAIFAVAHRLFGPGPVAYQALACASVFAGALLVYALARALVDRVSATVAGVLYLVLLSLYGSYSGQTEEFHTPMMLAMLWLVRDWRRPDAARRAALAMALGGLALQIKYTVLPQCLFFGAYALYGAWRAGARWSGLAKRAALYAVLGVLPTALVALLYWWWGHFDQFWFANFVSFFERAPAPTGRLRRDLFAALVPLALLVALGLGALGIYAAFGRKPLRDGRTYGLYLAFALAALATVLMPGTVYLYYYGTMAAPAVLIALPLIDVRSPARFVPAVLLLLAAWYLLNLPARHAHAGNDRRAAARMAAAIAPYVGTKRDCLYVFDGPTVLYRTTGTCVPTRFVYPDHLNNGLEIHSLEVDQPTEIARILANRPGVIVTANYAVTVQRKVNLDLIDEATRRDYRPLITSALQHREITAWVRKDLVRARSSAAPASAPRARDRDRRR